MHMSAHHFLYSGYIHHRRLQPIQHQFSYQIFMALLDCDHLESLPEHGIQLSRFAAASFNTQDYLNGDNLKQTAQDHIFRLTGDHLTGKVLLLCQLRYFGFYFNPVNFYYLYDSEGQLRWILAEVRNTPWNQRHTYAVKPDGSKINQKEFHVSPFNPMDMSYHWALTPPNKDLLIHIENHRNGKIFEASLVLKQHALTRQNLRHQLWSMPLMTLKTIFIIYWQAVILWFKGAPYYPIPKSSNKK